MSNLDSCILHYLKKKMVKNYVFLIVMQLNNYFVIFFILFNNLKKPFNC